MALKMGPLNISYICKQERLIPMAVPLDSSLCRLQNRDQLFKGWIKLTTREISIQWINVDKTDCTIQSLINWGQPAISGKPNNCYINLVRQTTIKTDSSLGGIPTTTKHLRS